MQSGIIYKSLRYRNKNKDTETNRAMKMNIENWTLNLLKSECAGRAFSERETKSINFF